jgi:antirestriction protein ArdC
MLEEAVSNPGILHEAYSRFWNYSLANQILALLQCHARSLEPGPLASFNKWKELGRRVKKGEKALTLCMPLRIKCKEWDEQRREAGLVEDSSGNAGYRTVFVYRRNWFVLSQTEGAPYTPEPIPTWDKEAALAALNIRQEPFTGIDGNCQGYATQKRTVAVSPVAGLPWKTLFHAVAHIVLGHVGQGGLSDGETPERSLREVEAESVALLCCDTLGMEGSAFCRGYIQSWLAGDGIPEKSAQRIMGAAATILRAGVPAPRLTEETTGGAS